MHLKQKCADIRTTNKYGTSDTRSRHMQSGVTKSKALYTGFLVCVYFRVVFSFNMFKCLKVGLFEMATILTM